MGCLKLPYDREREPLPFLGIWKGKGLEKSTFYFGSDLEEKSVAQKKCTNYTPFGAVAKVWNNEEQTQQEKYRYGYQGQYAEQDTVTGWNSFELRMYDPLIGRFLSVDPARQFASPYVGMGNSPIIGVDPTGGICPTCPKGSQYDAYRNADQAFGFEEGLGVYNSDLDFTVHGSSSVLDATTAILSNTVTTSNSTCHNCDNTQYTNKDWGAAGDLLNSGSFVYTLGTLNNGSGPAQLTNRTFLLTGIFLDAASKDLINNTQDQVDFTINTSASVTAYYITSLAPLAAYVNYASAHKEAVIELTEKATESYHINYDRTQETTNRLLRIQQEARRKRQEQRRNGN